MSQQDIITHIQDAVRPGETIDVYYSNQQNSVKQAHPTTVENRYFLNLQSLNFGTANTLIFNPDEGVDHIVLVLRLPAPSAVGGGSLPQGQSFYNGCALNKGWGYSMIRRVGVRYGNSSLYYFSGDQMLIDVLSDCEDSDKKQKMFELGGQQLRPLANGGNTSSVAGDWTSDTARTAYVYIKLPHNSPSAQELPLPLPTDLLTAPVQVNVEFKLASEVFNTSAYVAGVGSNSLITLPQGFDTAYAQFKQTHFDDRGEQLARKVNMSEMAYSYPLKYFSQEVFRIQNVPGGVSNFPITLTGLRSGNCLGIRMWARPNYPTTADASGTILTNPWTYLAPLSVQLSVNGLIYFDSRNGQQQLWNLLDRKTSASWNADFLVVNGQNFADTQTLAPNIPQVSSWVWIPFGQHTETLANQSELSHGLSLMNSIVNAQITLPDVSPVSTYTLTAEYIFNSTLLFSRGGCEYVF